MSEQDPKVMPDDVWKYLESVRDMSGSSVTALELLEKYAPPKPKELEDIGWVRFVKHRGETLIEPDFSYGINVDCELRTWPKVDGVHPSDLLNDGWVIRTLGTVPKDWHVAGRDAAIADLNVIELARFDAFGQTNMLVFCRPPVKEGS